MFEPNVAEGVHRVEDSYTNWYVVESDDGRLTIVDAGVPTSWASLEEALGRLGRSLGDVEALVLTHGHFDHIGIAEKLRRHGIPVYVHENDVPLTKHPHQYSHELPRTHYLATKPKALPMVASFVRTRAFWPTPVGEVQRFDNGSLPVGGSPRVVATPGHTHGHVSLHYPDRDVVIAGDAVVTLNPYTGGRGPQIVARAATADSDRALRSLDALAETGARTLLVGHGEPWRQGAEAAVEQAWRVGAT
jgi:glyoxylase-like metal-dependent hydrolase (beta-lactamase superfamily II)